MPEFAGPVAVLDPGNFSPQYTANFCSSLAQRGIDVSLFTSPPQFGEMLPPTGYRVETCFFRWLSRPGLLRKATAGHVGARMLLKACAYPFGLARTRRLLQIKKTRGILHYQWAHLPLLDLALLSMLRKAAWLAVATAHEFTAPSLFSSFGKWQMRRFYRSVDVVIVHTSRLAREAAEQLDVPLSKIHVIPRGDLGLFRGRLLSREEARTRIRIGTSGPVVLFFGMIKPNKGLTHLLRAMPDVLRDFPDARLVIAGEPIERFSKYQAIIDRLGIGHAVIARLSYIEEEEVSAYFYATDLVILPHTEVSLSGVAWVAMGFGRPIIGTNIGGLPDLIQNDVNGVLVPPGSSAALSDAITRLLRDPKKSELFGQRAEQQFQLRYGWTKTAKETAQLYDHLIRNAEISSGA